MLIWCECNFICIEMKLLNEHEDDKFLLVDECIYGICDLKHKMHSKLSSIVVSNETDVRPNITLCN